MTSERGRADGRKKDVLQSCGFIGTIPSYEEIDPLTAKAMIYACNSALTAVRTDEYKRKVEELEALLIEQQERDK